MLMEGLPPPTVATPTSQTLRDAERLVAKATGLWQLSLFHWLTDNFSTLFSPFFSHLFRHSSSMFRFVPPSLFSPIAILPSHIFYFSLTSHHQFSLHLNPSHSLVIIILSLSLSTALSFFYFNFFFSTCTFSSSLPPSLHFPPTWLESL